MQEGVKHDQGKAQWSLFPFSAAEPIVRVLMFGAKKYAVDNWKVVPDARRRYLDAAFRHLAAFSDGEKDDPESGLSHLAHAGCCILFLLWFSTQTEE